MEIYKFMRGIAREDSQTPFPRMTMSNAGGHSFKRGKICKHLQGTFFIPITIRA